MKNAGGKKKVVEVQFHKLTVMSGITMGKPVWRGVIVFAPGPYGTLFTDTYTGRGGAEMAVDKFCSTVLGSDWEVKK